MSTETTLAPEKTGASEETKAAARSFTRIARYTVVRLLTLFVTVVIGVYLTIMIANMGGYVDNIRSGEIREAVASG